MPEKSSSMKSIAPNNLPCEWREAFCKAWEKATDKGGFVDCAPVEVRLCRDHLDAVAKGETFQIILPCHIEGQMRMGCARNQYVCVCTVDRRNAGWIKECGWLNIAWVCDARLAEYLQGVQRGEKSHDCHDVFTALANKIVKHHEKDAARCKEYVAKFKRAAKKQRAEHGAWKAANAELWKRVKPIVKPR